MILVEDGIFQKLKSLKRSFRGKKILDLGCGHGDFTNLLGERRTVTGVDLQNVVRTHYKNFTYKKGDITRLPFKDNSFDLVVSFDVIEHVEKDNKMVREAYRVLRKGGKVFFGTPNKDRLVNALLAFIGRPRTYPLDLGTDPGLGATIHIREYTEKNLSDMFIKAGFQKVKVEPYWFGLTALHYGLRHAPPFLKKYSHYLFVEGIKK